VQATLPISEGGCGVASASNVAPVARLAGILSSSSERSQFWIATGNWSSHWPPRRGRPSCPPAPNTEAPGKLDAHG